MLMCDFERGSSAMYNWWPAGCKVHNLGLMQQTVSDAPMLPPSRLWRQLHVWKRSAAGAFIFGHLHPLSWQVPRLRNLAPDGETTQEQLPVPVNDTGAAAAPAEQAKGTQNAIYRCSTSSVALASFLMALLLHCIPSPSPVQTGLQRI
jgi:hypothetical protein